MFFVWLLVIIVLVQMRVLDSVHIAVHHHLKDYIGQTVFWQNFVVCLSVDDDNNN